MESRDKYEEEFEEFKRINFFKGFFTRAEDWQQAEQYHIDKRRLHNISLHTPGVIQGYREGLKVWAGPDGREINIGPGCAIDGRGRELYLEDTETKPIDPQGYRPPKTVYVVIRYGEKEVDPRESHADPESTKYAFWKEKTEAYITETEPDNREVIELARIVLSEGATKVSEPEDSHNPTPNEIDRRYVKRAGARGRMRLADISEEVGVEREMKVAVSEDAVPSENDPNVQIEKIDGEDRERFYLVNAYPVGPAPKDDEPVRISWRVESGFDGDAVEYRLYFKNFSSESVKVAYRVLRLV